MHSVNTQLSLHVQVVPRPSARGRVAACPTPCRGCPTGGIAAHRRRVASPRARPCTMCPPCRAPARPTPARPVPARPAPACPAPNAPTPSAQLPYAPSPASPCLCAPCRAPTRPPVPLAYAPTHPAPARLVPLGPAPLLVTINFH